MTSPVVEGFRSLVSHVRSASRWSCMAILWLCCVETLRAEVLRTQQIALVEGWNAIWLEVDPSDDRVVATFDPGKIDVVARYFTPNTPVRFLQDPNEKPWNTPGWKVWYAPSRAEAFLTSLHAVHGGSAYLVHATAAHTLSVTGAVQYRPQRWNANSFNLAGLPVTGSPGMTFARFFSGANGRLGTQVYRLVEGSWQKVGNLGSTPIRAGEAFWVYCEGRTSYQGPLEVKFTGGNGINLRLNSSLAVIDLINRGTSPLSVKVSVEGDIPLYRSIPDLANLSSTSLPISGEIDLATIPAGESSELRLEFRPTQTTAASGSALLTLTTSDGNVLRVPIHAKNH